MFHLCVKTPHTHFTGARTHFNIDKTVENQQELIIYILSLHVFNIHCDTVLVLYGNEDNTILPVLNSGMKAPILGYKDIDFLQAIQTIADCNEVSHKCNNMSDVRLDVCHKSVQPTIYNSLTYLQQQKHYKRANIQVTLWRSSQSH